MKTKEDKKLDWVVDKSHIYKRYDDYYDDDGYINCYNDSSLDKDNHRLLKDNDRLLDELDWIHKEIVKQEDKLREIVAKRTEFETEFDLFMKEKNKEKKVIETELKNKYKVFEEELAAKKKVVDEMAKKVAADRKKVDAAMAALELF